MSGKSLIPVEGVHLREAMTTEIRQMCDLVCSELQKKIGDGMYMCVEAMYPDRVIVQMGGRFMAYAYTIGADNQVTFGEPTEVVEQYVNVREAVANLASGDVIFIEAADDNSGRWLVRVIKAGMSINGNFYPDAVLRESVSLFDGVRVFEKPEADHIKGGTAGKSVANLIGAIQKPRFVEGKTPDTGEIQADLVLIEPNGDTAVKLREAKARNLIHLLGLSIDADGTAKTQLREGRKVRVAQSITKVHSVDLIVEPSAGGELIRLIEAVANPVTSQEGDPMRNRMIEVIKTHNPAFDGANATEEQIEVAYREAVTAKAKPVAPGATQAALDAVDERIRMIEARSAARATIANAKLPQAAKDRISADFERRERFVEADVTTAIEAERTYLAKFTESGKPVIQLEHVEVEDRTVKIADMLDAFFDPKHKEHRNVQSFKECYIEITGDRRLTGELRHCDPVRLREAAGDRFFESIASTTLANALGDSITRRMQQIFTGLTNLQTWRKVARIGQAKDFRTQERFRIGGYGNLPAVAQGAAYTALTSPSDAKATYAVSKRGGTEDVTMESIVNDDVAAIRQIPNELALAAANTLYEFVFDFYRTNPVIYDGTALYTAGHGNLASAALSAAEFAAHRLKMTEMTRAGSLKRLGVQPATVLVPFELQETAFNLFVRGQNLDKTFVQTINPEVIVPAYWTDVTDWCTVADPNVAPVLEISFLNGQEDPELFVQDMANVGSLFSNDKITYKIRHIYGGNVLVDGEKFTTKAVVAG